MVCVCVSEPDQELIVSDPSLCIHISDLSERGKN